MAIKNLPAETFEATVERGIILVESVSDGERVGLREGRVVHRT